MKRKGYRKQSCCSLEKHAIHNTQGVGNGTKSNVNFAVFLKDHFQVTHSAMFNVSAPPASPAVTAGKPKQ